MNGFDTLDIVSLAWIGLAVLLLPVLLRITAPYGRHSKRNWGPMISNRYGWLLMEMPSLVVFSALVLWQGIPDDWPARVFALAWVAHYFHRAVIFPFQLRTRGKKMPVLIMVFAILFNLVNASLNGYWLGIMTPDYGNTWFLDLRFLLGAALFVAGFVINRYHDRILIRLRKSDTNGYSIPYGGLFRWVSCPNHLGEMVEWGGFALMTWGLPSLSFFIWTIANLLPRALDHHRWYRGHFESYPKDRKALVPFVM